MTNENKVTTIFSPFTSKKKLLRIAALLCLAFLVFSSTSVMSTRACVPPVAQFSYSPSEPLVNQTVTFNASASYDPDGNITKYAWDFGDGTTGCGMIVNHTYTASGAYIVTLTVKDDRCLENKRSVIVSVSKPTLTVQTYVGPMHFAGEMAEFYVLVSQSGKPVNATLSVMLYYGGVLYNNLSASIEYVKQGFYRIPYEIPLEASAGAYVLTAEVNCFGVQEIALEGFLVSPTLTGWNAWLVNIQDGIVTIKTDVSTIKTSLEAINATLVSIEGGVATIVTNIGEIKADIHAINATITRIEGDVAVINSNVGGLKVNLDQINATISSFEGRIVNIETDLGIIKTSIDNINVTVKSINGTTVTLSTDLGDLEGTIESIRGDIAFIKTKLGDIEANLPSTQATALGVSLGTIFAAIAAVASVIVAALLLIKRKKPTIF